MPLYQQLAVTCADFIEIQGFQGNVAEKLEFLEMNYQQLLDHFYLISLIDEDFDADDVYLLYTLLGNIPAHMIFHNEQFAGLIVTIMEALGVDNEE